MKFTDKDTSQIQSYLPAAVISEDSKIIENGNLNEIEITAEE